MILLSTREPARPRARNRGIPSLRHRLGRAGGLRTWVAVGPVPFRLALALPPEREEKPVVAMTDEARARWESAREIAELEQLAAWLLALFRKSQWH